MYQNVLKQFKKNNKDIYQKIYKKYLSIYI